MAIPAHLVDFWAGFAAAHPGADEGRFYEAFAFGDSAELADELLALVLQGRKRATAAALWTFEVEGRRPPQPGDLSIVTDGTGRPHCVIETREVEVRPFAEVGADFAAAEGEGDGSLDFWRRVHREFFGRECARAGRPFSEDMPVLCERFERLHPEAAAPHLGEQVLRALVLYALAEAQLGHARHLRVSAEGDRFAVEDDGRGHAIARTVEGAPYLQFIYGHLDYPFGAAQSRPVQLQGLGMSLVNAVCAELTVRVRKPDARLDLAFRGGRLIDHRAAEGGDGTRGNRLAGRIDARFEPRPFDTGALARWLAALAATQAGLALSFNGQPLPAAAAG